MQARETAIQSARRRKKSPSGDGARGWKNLFAFAFARCAERSASLVLFDEKVVDLLGFVQARRESRSSAAFRRAEEEGERLEVIGVLVVGRGNHEKEANRHIVEGLKIRDIAIWKHQTIRRDR